MKDKKYSSPKFQIRFNRNKITVSNCYIVFLYF